MSELKQVRKIALTGDEAVAYAAKQADVDVIAAYPITPQTIIVERLSKYVADGELNAAFIQAESEHSAISICLGAALAGARTFTSTASQGLALMHEVLHIASSMRAPIVMAIANRALNSPLNIHCDHSDIMNARDTGWVHLFANNVQQAYDLTIMAFKIAEDPELLLPVSVNLDGFILTHSVEPLEVLSDEDVQSYIPHIPYPYRIDFDRPLAYGVMALPDTYMEFRRQLYEVIIKAPKVFRKASESFSKISGRLYNLIAPYFLEDAEIIVLALGSTVETLRYVARKFRGRNVKIGVVGLTMYRPFPEKEIADTLANAKCVAVMDRAYSYGGVGGPLYTDILSTLYKNGIRTMIADFIYGLGGRDFKLTDAEELFSKLVKSVEVGRFDQDIYWWGVRE
ncbi:MAG: pyruvate ferredoxin oxidoreductase [Thaumarchaeota archaeon]|jgi:pyruvate ferredoxin oxidoreductase alpha subunit|nr:pyruvate ferredoxin oxidoreductase [Candidatus Geocrenenecus arthurdayi]MCL7401434.1 pyruvate ferredoxin oxidoreductase [Candidatus Geocrenenecus arthurdayi]